MENKFYRRPFKVLEELKAIADKGQRVVLVFDMDGVLVEFIDDENVIPNWRKKMLEKGYYASLPKIPNGVEFAEQAIEMLGKENVYICTKGPTPHSYKEKIQWIGNHLPDLDPDNMVAIGFDEVKAEVIHALLKTRGIDPACAILVDDYGQNLKEWYDAWVKIGGCDYLVSPTIKAYNGHNLKGKRNQLCPVIQLQTREQSRQVWKKHRQIN